MEDQNKHFFLILTSLVFLFCLCNYKLLVGEAIFTHDSIYCFPLYYNYIVAIGKGIIPYWNPFMSTGTPFYPNFPSMGVLDPLCLLSAVLVKIFGISYISGYTLFYLSRLFVLVIGAYFLFKRITKNRISALLAAGILLFSVAPVSYRQGSIVFPLFLVPFALYFLLSFLDNLEKKLQKYLYFSCLIITIGIASHIYIPALFILNIITFFILIIFMKLISFKKLLTVFKDKNFLVYSIISLLLLVMMLAPSLGLLKDVSSDGELFPSIRIFQKNNNLFKKMIASEIDTFLLSEKFNDNKGVYSSYGNMLNLIYPGIFAQYFYGGPLKDYSKNINFISETFQYIGIIPFILCIFGFLYCNSRYRYLAFIMMMIISLNMLSFNGVHRMPPNLIQEAFNKIFPTLPMIEAREILSANFLLYLCMLLSLGFNIFFNSELIKKRKNQIIIICISIVILKIILAVIFVYPSFPYILEHLAKVSAFVTMTDLWSFIAVILFAILIYKYSSDGLISKKIFYSTTVTIIFIDLFLYNFTVNKYTLQDNWIAKKMFPALEKVQSSKNYFEYFRYPMIWPQEKYIFRLSYSDVIPRTKAIINRGYNYDLFSTKRYYDLLTNIPLQNHFLLGGAVFPIIRFYPEEKVKWKSKKEVFNFYTKLREVDSFGEYLLLENKTPEGARGAGKFGFKSFDQFEDVPWLKIHNIRSAYLEFMQTNKDKIKMIRNNVKQFLETKDHAIKVKYFSDNELRLLIKNEKGGYLYYNDGWSKYWKAFDSGQEIPVYIANYNSKAVFLKPGNHLLRFVFDPVYYRLGLWSYHIGLFFSCILIVFFLLKRNKKANPSSVEQFTV